MFPPSGGYSLDIEAISGICGSISIACWVVVFSPQIIENFRRSSAEGLSIEFIIIWLAGDVFNILGAVLQGVLPTMIILAIYYTFADIVLLLQYFYYCGFRLRDPKPESKVAHVENGDPNERTPLVQNGQANGHVISAADIDPARARSSSAFRERFASLDGTHMSPAVPMHPQPKNVDAVEAAKPKAPRTILQAVLFNSTAILLVVAAGIAGYYLSPSTPNEPNAHERSPADEQAQSLQFSTWGQIFGYICAVLYLGSRIPQLLLNYRRKSTEG
jgi:solute carrier family 66 (lysosomal lysine-arginine transporter), member 1